MLIGNRMQPSDITIINRVTNKKNILSNSESVQCNFFHFWSRDVHPVQNLLLCTKFHQNRMISCDDITIFKMVAVRHLGIVLPPYETTHEVCCWLQLPVKFHVNLIHRSEDIAIWFFFAYLAWNAYSGPQNGCFGGLWTHKCDYSSSRPPKANPCINLHLLSYQL